MELNDEQVRIRSQLIGILVVGLLFPPLRIWCRIKRGLVFAIDDYLACIVLIFFAAEFGGFIWLINTGLTIPFLELSEPTTVLFLKGIIFCEVTYTFAISFVKFSILFMYIRIFPTRRMIIGASAVGFFTFGWMIAISCISMFACNPIQKAWHPLLEGKCITSKNNMLINGPLNIVGDLSMLALPIPELWTLQMSVSRRLSLIAVFASGIATSAVSIWRFAQVLKIDANDPTSGMVVAVLPSLLETMVAIICANLPALRPIYNTLIDLVGKIPGMGSLRTHSSENKQSWGPNSLKTFGSSGPMGARRNFQDTQLDTLAPVHGETSADASATKTYYNITGESDEVPLNGIHVRSEVEWKASGGRPLTGDGSLTPTSTNSQSNNHSDIGRVH